LFHSLNEGIFYSFIVFAWCAARVKSLPRGHNDEIRRQFTAGHSFHFLF